MQPVGCIIMNVQQGYSTVLTLVWASSASFAQDESSILLKAAPFYVERVTAQLVVRFKFLEPLSNNGLPSAKKVFCFFPIHRVA